MASWLVRALLCGSRCSGLGWTAGVRYRRSRGGAVVAGNTAAGSADAAARPENRVAGPDERLGGDPRQRGKVLSGIFPGLAADDPSASRADGGLRPGAFMPIARDASFPDLPPLGSNPPREARGAACRLQRRQGGGFGHQAGSPRGSGPWRLIHSASVGKASLPLSARRAATRGEDGRAERGQVRWSRRARGATFAKRNGETERRPLTHPRALRPGGRAMRSLRLRNPLPFGARGN
jgi:hypothetical protein